MSLVIGLGHRHRHHQPASLLPAVICPKVAVRRSKKLVRLAYRLGSSLINHILETKLHSRHGHVTQSASQHCRLLLSAQSERASRCVCVHKTLFRFRTYPVVHARTHVHVRVCARARRPGVYFPGSQFHSAMCPARAYIIQIGFVRWSTPRHSSLLRPSSSYEFYSFRPAPRRCVSERVCECVFLQALTRTA